MIKNKWFVVVAIVLCYQMLNATTYTFIGRPEGVSGNPLYQNINNWENNLYPGTTISAGDTVNILSSCVNNEQELHVYGHLNIQERLDGKNIIVFESGALELNGTMGNSIIARGIVSVSGIISTALTCEGCMLYPGGVDQVGLIDIGTLIIDSTSTIIVDINSDGANDVIAGRGASLSGHLLLNFDVDNNIFAHCADYHVFTLRSPGFIIDLESIKATSNDNLSGRLAGSGIVSVFLDSDLDRALHFDGSNDYVSSTESLGLARTIEFRMTPGQIGPSEDGQMIFNMNDELLEYIIINSTTSAFSNETLSIKNGAGFGLNWLYTTYEFESGETYHISIVANDQDRYDKIYVNGQEVESLTGTELPPLFDIDRFDIGTRDNDFFYRGKMDEVRIWSYIRTPTEIADNAFDFLDPLDTIGLTLYYKFDQGVPYEDNECIDFLVDEQSDNHGKLNNFNLYNFGLLRPNLNTSNWVHAGCRVMNETMDNTKNWNTAMEWDLGVVPDGQCHDVRIRGLEQPLLVRDTTAAACISLEIEDNYTFSVEAGGTLEVKGK